MSADQRTSLVIEEIGSKIDRVLAIESKVDRILEVLDGREKNNEK
jgi:hypothetical protein